MAARYWVGGTGTWDDTSTINWSATSGGASGASAPTNTDTVTIDVSSGTGTITIAATARAAAVTLNSSTLGVTLGANFATGGTFTLTLGSINLGGYNLTCNVFSSASGVTRSIAFGSNYVILNNSASAATVLDISIATNFTPSGTGGFKITGGPTGGQNQTAIIGTTGGSAATAPNLWIAQTLVGGISPTFTIASNSVLNNLTTAGASITLVANALTLYDSVTLPANTVAGPSGTSTWTFAATSTGKTIDTNSASLYNATFSGVGGGWTLLSTFSTSNILTLAQGTLALNGFDTNITTFSISNGTLSIGSSSLFCSTTLTQTGGTITATTGNVQAATFTSTTGTRAINMGSGTWTLSGTGTVWNVASAGLTMSAGTSTIILSDNTTTAKTFAGGGVAYYSLQIGRGTGTSNAIATYTITGSNTFAGTVSSTKTVASTITLPASTTTTVGSWTISGTAGNLITVNSSTAGTQATLAKSGGGQVSVNYLNIRDSAATPSTLTWYAGANSTNTSNNTGWIFTAPPGPIIASRLTKTGVLYANGYFDEVTQATISTTPTALYSAQFDEVTLNGQPSPQRRELSTGVVQVNGYFDETAGPLT
jgi:hypothetical protein